MLYSSALGFYGWTYDNFPTNPSTNVGALVTAGTNPGDESATPLVLATSANITEDVYAMQINVFNQSGTLNRCQLMDIGFDPAGGTSYTWLINNIVCGNAGGYTVAQQGYRFFFPIRIPAGSQIACRTACNQGLITTYVGAKFYGKPERPQQMLSGTFSETIGTVSTVSGQNFTPGNASDGAWTNLGATTNPMWWWQLSYNVSNPTITAEQTYIDLAWGDASNKHIIMRGMHIGSTTEFCSEVLGVNLSPAAYCRVPAGANIYVRGRCVNAPDAGYDATAIGIGG